MSNLVDTIKTLKKHGVWVYGAEADGTPIDKADLSGALALVIGSEGFGLGKLVRENCDVVLSLPMFGEVNSAQRFGLRRHTDVRGGQIQIKARPENKKRRERS